jgi:hypothetical protein
VSRDATPSVAKLAASSAALSRTSPFLCNSEFMLEMSALQQRISLLDQAFKLFSLLCDPVRVSSFILGA